MPQLLTLTAIFALVSSLEASVLRQKKQSFLILSTDNTGIHCLNGGTSIPSLHSGQHMFCMCADGYSGNSCEIDMSATCFVGIGLRYRGPVSRAQSGRECLEWNPENTVRVFGAESLYLGLGRHNRCRNPDYSRRPWCYVKRPYGVVKEYCDVPHCAIEPYPVPHQPNTSVMESTCGERKKRGKLHKIVGGSVAPVESHPWMAAIFWKSSRKTRVFRCGGSLISSCWVLTAAHCFPDGPQTKAQKLSVILGKSSINETKTSTEQVFQIAEVIIHADFDNSEGNFNNDIALLKIRRRDGQCAKETSSVRTVCLPLPHQTLPAGVSCEISGYGKEQEGLWYYSQNLREGKVNLLSQDVCTSKSYYGNMITDNMFCAGNPDWTTDSCKGDSGGPLVCRVDNRMFLFGIVSWGEGCSRELRPGVYTRVTNYNQWIEEKTSLSAITSESMFPLE